MCARLSPSRSRSSPALRSRCSSRGLSSITLLLALSLISSPLYGQSLQQTSPLGPSDYQEYRASLGVLEAKVSFYKTSLQQAVNENSTIRDELEKLRAAQAQHNSDSTTSYEEQQQTIQRLTARLATSDALVSGLQQSLESAQAEYDQKLQQAQARAKSLERERDFWRATAVVSAVVAVVFGIKAAMK